MDINAGKDIYDDVCFTIEEVMVLRDILKSKYNTTELVSKMRSISDILPKIFGAKRHILKSTNVDHSLTRNTSDYFIVTTLNNYSSDEIKVITALKLVWLRKIGFGGFKALEHPVILELERLFYGYDFIVANPSLEKEAIKIIMAGGFSDVLLSFVRAYVDDVVVELLPTGTSDFNVLIDILDVNRPS